MSIKVQKIYISDLCLFVFSIIQFNGLLSTVDNGIYLVSGLLWLLFATIEDGESLSKAITCKNTALLLLYAMLFMIISLSKNSIGTVIAGTLFQLIQYSAFIFCKFYIIHHDINRNTLVARILILIVLFYLIRAIIYYQSDPTLARNTVSNPDLIVRGIGGNAYGLCFVSNAISLFYLNLTINKSNKISKFNRIFGIVFITLSIILTLSVDSATTTFIFALAIIISVLNQLFVYKRSNEGNMKVFLRGILLYLFVFLLLIFLKSSLGGLILAFCDLGIGGAFFNDRLLGIGNTLVGNELVLGLSFDERVILLNNSWNSFLDYPLFGASIHYEELTYSQLGQHSEIFDLLAKYGIIGAGSLLLAIGISIKELYKPKYDGIIIYIILLGILNPLHYPQAIMAMLVTIPLLINNSSESLKTEESL